MISLSNYIDESIFDDDDIHMDKIDSDVTLINYFNKLTNPATFKDAYIELEHHIKKKCKKVTISSMTTAHSYIAFTQKDIHGWFDHDNIHSLDYIFGEHLKRGFNKCNVSLKISMRIMYPEKG